MTTDRPWWVHWTGFVDDLGYDLYWEGKVDCVRVYADKDRVEAGAYVSTPQAFSQLLEKALMGDENAILALDIISSYNPDYFQYQETVKELREAYQCPYPPRNASELHATRSVT